MALDQPKDLFIVYVLELEHGKYYVGRTQKSDVSARYDAHCSGRGAAWTKLHPPVKIVEQTDGGDKWAEDAVVYRYMEKYTTDNVRGGSYCQTELSAEQRQELETKLKSVNDACYRCGAKGHFAKWCSKKAAVSERRRSRSPSRERQPEIKARYRGAKSAGRRRSRSQSRERRETKARSRRSRSRSPAHRVSKTKKPAPKTKKPKEAGSLACHRCGRNSHWEAECFAKRDQGVTVPDHRGPPVIECFQCGRPGHVSTDCYATRDIAGNVLRRVR